MGNTTISSGNREKRFLSDFFSEYVRDNRFSRFSGTNENNIIHVKEDAKKVISIPLVAKLRGAAKVGNSTLTGSEDTLANYNWDMTTTYRRNAVRVTMEEKDAPAFDIMSAARGALMTWSMEDLRDEIILNMAAVYNGTTYAKADDTTAGVRNTWNSNNSDRVLYGAATSNYNATFATALATVDSTTDKLTPDIIDLAKNIAVTADPGIRPVRVQEDDEYFVMFVGSTARYHLGNNATMVAANRDARERGVNNPLFRGGDLLWDNVLIREVPEITKLFNGSTSTSLFKTGGNGSTAVEPAFFCGAQALGWAMGERPGLKVDSDYDYGFQPGVAVQKKELVNKLFFNNKQHGMVSVFVTGVR